MMSSTKSVVIIFIVFFRASIYVMDICLPETNSTKWMSSIVSFDPPLDHGPTNLLQLHSTNNKRWCQE